MAKIKDAPTEPITVDEKRKILQKTFISKQDFIYISDLKKLEALRVFNAVRKRYIEERTAAGYDASYYIDPSSNYLPTNFLLKVFPTFKMFLKGSITP